MALARTQREWAILVSEFNICKKKLESKREALKIITKEWQTSKRETEIYKNKVHQLQQDLDKYITKEKKKKETNQEQEQEIPLECVQSPDLINNHTSMDTLAQLVCEYKRANKALRHDFQELKRLYIESQEDVQLMRDRMRRQSSSSSIPHDETPDNNTEGKEEYIAQLEEYKEQLANLEQEVKSIKDENSDIRSERDYYIEKCERLNTQLNYILGADDQRLVDIDALVLDNKYLKEKLTLLEEERNLEKESIQKYEAAFEKKKSKILNQGNNRVLSHYSKHSTDHSLKTVADLRNVANILSETISEKNLALSHQRNANRILGKRVSELENKLKTLEVAGLWSLPGHRGYGSANLANNDLDSPIQHAPEKHQSEGKTNTRFRRLEECSENNELVKLNDENALSLEINGNLMGSCCKDEGAPRVVPYITRQASPPDCSVCHADKSMHGPHQDALWDVRNSSSSPFSSFFNNSPENMNKPKLPRVSSAPCLTRSFSMGDTGDILN